MDHNDCPACEAEEGRCSWCGDCLKEHCRCVIKCRTCHDNEVDERGEQCEFCLMENKREECADFAMRLKNEW